MVLGFRVLRFRLYGLGCGVLHGKFLGPNITLPVGCLERDHSLDNLWLEVSEM